MVDLDPDTAIWMSVDGRMAKWVTTHRRDMKAISQRPERSSANSSQRRRPTKIQLDPYRRRSGVIRFLIAQPDFEGVVNLGIPHPVDNVTFMRTVRRVGGVLVPRALLEFGCWLLRTESELLLKSRWVISERMLLQDTSLSSRASIMPCGRLCATGPALAPPGRRR
jgi:hypothetical protein